MKAEDPDHARTAKPDLTPAPQPPRRSTGQTRTDPAESEAEPLCVFGEPILGPHPLCEAETDRGIAAFQADVLAGKYDAEGYTPAERKAQTKRLQQAGRLF